MTDTQPRTGSITSNGLTLRTLDWGPQDAEPVILVHGIRDHARNWDATAARLPDRRCVAIDLRGHGDSDWSPDGAYLLPYHVADLARLVDALGHEKVSIVGHSFGGSVASRYAGLYPDRVRALVVVDGFGPSDEIYAKWDAEGPVQRTLDWIAQREAMAARQPRPIPLADAAARLAQGNPRLTPAQLDHMARHSVRAEGDGFVWKFDPRVSIFAPEDFAIPIERFWQSITAPTLLCYGAESWSALAADDRRLPMLRDHKLLAIPEAGHWPHHDQLDLFVTAVREFLA